MQKWKVDLKQWSLLILIKVTWDNGLQISFKIMQGHLDIL